MGAADRMVTESSRAGGGPNLAKILLSYSVWGQRWPLRFSRMRQHAVTERQPHSGRLQGSSVVGTIAAGQWELTEFCRVSPGRPDDTRRP